MGLVLSVPINDARVIINDEGGDRYTDTQLLAYANSALLELVAIAPKFFYKKGVTANQAGENLQDLNLADAFALVDIVGIDGGNNVIGTTEEALSQFNPAWPSDPAGPALHWMKVRDDPLRYYIYPKAPSGQSLVALYTFIPPAFTALQDTGLSLVLAPAVTDYIVYRAESRDDEHAVSARASQFYAAFLGRFSKNPPATPKVSE